MHEGWSEVLVDAERHLRRVGICSAGPVLEAEAQHDKFIKHQLQSIQDAAFAHVAMKPHNVL